MEEKILYYGSFNPFTLAHKEITEILQQRFPNKKIVIKITPKNFYDKIGLLEDTHRIQIIRKSLHNNIHVTRIEDNKHLSFYEAAEFFSCKYVVLGADNLHTLKKYYKEEKGNSIYDLLNNKILIIFDRENQALDFINADSLLNTFRNNFIIIPFDNPISSSLFRETLNCDYITKEAREYIIKNNLYG